MRRTTAAIAAITLSLGGAVVLSAAVPGIASASGCGTTTVTPSNPQGFTFQGETFDSTGVNLTAGQSTQAYLDYDIAGSSGGKGVPLSDNTDQSKYVITADQGANVYKTGFAYYLGVDNNSDGTQDANLFYEPQSYGEGQWHTGGALNPDGSYTFTGTLAQYSALHPDASIDEIAGNYGPGVPAGTEHVQSLTFGCNTFNFKADPVVQANRPPTADFTHNESGLTVTVNNTSTDPDGDSLTCLWEYGDGDTSNACPNDTHTYQKSGTYDVKLTVSDGKGGTASKTESVTVKRDVASAQNPDGSLPNTGADVIGLSALGAVVLGGGAFGLVASRRRRAGAHTA